MRLLVLCSIFCLSVLSAKIPEYNDILKAPKGLAKDYYIYRYATEKKPSKAQLKELRAKIFRYAGNIKKKFDSSLGLIKIPSECPKDIWSANLACKKELLSTKFLEGLSIEERARLREHLKDLDNDMFVLATAFETLDPIGFITEQGSLWAFYRYLGASADLSKELAKYSFNPKMWEKLSKSRRFLNLLSEAVVLDKYPHVKEWLLGVKTNEPQGDAAFLAGLNAVLAKDDKKALGFFNQSAKTPTSAQGRDAALLWAYLISKDKEPLKELSKSKNINIYSLYAKELTQDKSLEYEIPNPSKESLENYDVSDPFVWQHTKDIAAKLGSEELASFAKRFYTKNTVGHYAYFMEKASKGAKNYFPLAYMEHIGSDDKARQALILALARQESRFIPAAISTSYALGMMQFMPFVANDIGIKKLAIPGFEQDDMFKPQTAYYFANFHLDYLENYLHNPVFIAYAYNGGLGFTKRMLLDGKLFNPKSEYKKYEPFLSLELVPLAESREYGKKVLANYIVYSSILGSNTKISKFFETLMKPGVSESFRP